VLQHTPRAVTSAPPLEVTLPPVEADVVVTPETAVVVKVGISASFLQPENVIVQAAKNSNMSDLETLFIILCYKKTL
jgi:hypothetical protein